MDINTTKDNVGDICRSIKSPSKFVLTIYHNDGTYVLDCSKGMMSIHNYNHNTKINEIVNYSDPHKIVEDYYKNIHRLNVVSVYIKIKGIPEAHTIIADFVPVCKENGWKLETICK